MEMMCRFYNSPYFNYVVDSHFCDILSLQIPLAEYFESELPFYQINHKEFPSLHPDDQEIITGVNTQTLKDIHSSYDSIFGQKVSSSDLSADNDTPRVAIEYFVVNMPETLTREPKKLMQTLSKEDRAEVFESGVVQTIIAFKWETYARAFFQR